MKTKVKKTKKEKKPNLSKLKKKLWTVCSQYIRLRDVYTCFTCGKRGEGSAIHAGHFIPSSTCGLLLRYDERNIHAQCFHCNLNLGGNGAIYYKRMVERFGQKFVDDIFKDKEKTTKWTVYDYTNKTEYYRIRLEELGGG